MSASSLSGSVRLALSVTLIVFIALLAGGMYAAQRHDDLLAEQTAVQWHAVKANNEAQRLSVFAERYFSGDQNVELATLQDRHAELLAELRGLREGPYARDLLAFSDLDSRFNALEAELVGLGNLLQRMDRNDTAALKNVRACLENAVLALTDAVTVAIRQMAGPQTASYWSNLLNILYFSIVVAAGGLVFLAAAVFKESVKNRKLAEQYKEAMAQAAMANRAKSRLLANVSHELRTPLNAIIGFSDILRDQVFGSLGHDRYREYSGFIRESGTHLLMLVDDLLNYAKHDDKNNMMNFGPVVVAGILEESKTLAMSEARRPDVEIVLDGSVFPTVLADAEAFRQIAANLMANAVRRSPSGGKVEIVLSVKQNPDERGDALLVQVLDRGAEISRGGADRLLHPFELRESDSFIAAPDDGAGFGMALAQKLAERHGGGVTLTARVGGGMIAAFSLPLLSGGTLE